MSGGNIRIYGLTYLIERFAPLTVWIPCFGFRNYKFIDCQILQFIYHSNWNISNLKIYNFEHIFCMLFFSGRAKYVHEHTSALPFLHKNHNRSPPAEQGLTPHSHHTRNKCSLMILYLMPLEVFYTHKLLYCPVCIFGCFHGNQRCVTSYHYFYTWGFYRKWISLVWWDPIHYQWSHDTGSVLWLVNP